MKKLFLSGLLLMGLLTARTQTTPAPAGAVLKEACSQAVKEQKNVLIMFHASWCSWCHKMDKSINDDACRQFFADNYVIRHLVVDETNEKKNLENPGAAELKTMYNGDGQGIPFWLIFDPQGNLLSDSKIRKEGDGPGEGDNTGCPASEKEVDFFIGVLKKTATLNQLQEEGIRKRFRQNDH